MAKIKADPSLNWLQLGLMTVEFKLKYEHGLTLKTLKSSTKTKSLVHLQALSTVILTVESPE